MISENLQTDELDLINKFDSKKNSSTKLNIEKFINDNKIPLALSLSGLIILGLGMFLYKDGYITGSDKIEVIQETGVYKMLNDARVEDLLIAAGGVSADADRFWMEKMLNRAARLTDGQKIFIPNINEQSEVLSDKVSREGGSSFQG